MLKAIVVKACGSLLESLRDLAPVVVVIGVFQLVVLQQPIPNLLDLAWGTAMVVIGLTLFVQGLKLGLFPIGETMAWDFARKGSLLWLLAFAFSLGFGTTVAEPALIAVAEEAAEVAANGGMIDTPRPPAPPMPKDCAIRWPLLSAWPLSSVCCASCAAGLSNI